MSEQDAKYITNGLFYRERLPDCEHECGYSEIKNGECECYNREMDKREEQAPC